RARPGRGGGSGAGRYRRPAAAARLRARARAPGPGTAAGGRVLRPGDGQRRGPGRARQPPGPAQAPGRPLRRGRRDRPPLGLILPGARRATCPPCPRVPQVTLRAPPGAGLQAAFARSRYPALMPLPRRIQTTLPLLVLAMAPALALARGTIQKVEIDGLEKEPAIEQNVRLGLGSTTCSARSRASPAWSCCCSTPSATPGGRWSRSATTRR